MDEGKPSAELVSVVVVTRNGIRFLPDSIRQLKRQSYPNIELVVVDNGSTDGSPEFVESNFPGATVIRCVRNAGFSRGNNIGIKLSAGEYVLALNQDVNLEPDFIESLVDVMRSDGRIGAVCGKIYRARAGGAHTNVIDSAGMVLLRNRNALNRGSEEDDSAELSTAAEVFGAPASAALYRKKMLDELRVGEEYFDEDFFAYFEDVDLSWRARALGWRTVYAPQGIGYHVRISGFFVGPGGSRFVSEHLWRNRYLTIVKNDTVWDMLLDLPRILWFELVHLAVSVLYRGWRLKALLKALRLVPKMVRKRRAFRRSARRLVRTREWYGVDSRPIGWNGGRI